MDVPQHPAARRQRTQLDARRRLGERLLRRTRTTRARPRGRHGLVRPRGVRHPRLRPARPTGRAVRRPARPDPARARPGHAAARHAEAARPPRTSRASTPGRTSAPAPTSTSTPKDRAVVATTDGRILEFATSTPHGHGTAEAGAGLRRLRRAAGPRLPGRADAGLGRPDLVRHPGRPRRDGRPRDRRGAGDRPGRGHLQLARRRRAGRVRRHRHRAVPDERRLLGSTARATGVRRTTGAASRSPASSPAAAAPPRPCSRAAASRSPTTPIPGCTSSSTTPRPVERSAGRRSSATEPAPPRTHWSRSVTVSSRRTTTATPGR